MEINIFNLIPYLVGLGTILLTADPFRSSPSAVGWSGFTVVAVALLIWFLADKDDEDNDDSFA